MENSLILPILLSLGLFITFVSSELPPTDENGRIICKPEDSICEKFKQMMENPTSYFHRTQWNIRRKELRKNPETLKCDSPWARNLCESMDKICYEDGHCGDLVNEEKSADTSEEEVVFDEENSN